MQNQIYDFQTIPLSLFALVNFFIIGQNLSENIKFEFALYMFIAGHVNCYCLFGYERVHLADTPCDLLRVLMIRRGTSTLKALNTFI